MKSVLACVLAAALASTASAATNPLTVPTKLEPAWQAKTRDVFKQAIEIPSVHHRGEMPRMAKLLADQFRAAGIPESDIHIMPYEALPGDKTVALIVRWRSPHATKKPMMILGHMDVVEAKREDWKFDPFVFREEGGYFLGRGTSDMKNGDVATTMAAVKLMSEGFKPNRDIIFFYSGDEETNGRGATLGASEWRNLTDAEFGLNADGGCGAYDKNFRPLGCGISTAEKTFQTYFFTTINPGGHSSRPRPDNAIYDLADALKALQNHRFTPMMNETSRGYFEERARQEGNSALGNAMRRWLANPNDGAAADEIEANPLEVGLTRTRCVATMLEGGHADNALPQRAKATVNCRIMPGVQPKDVQAELQQLAGPKVQVTPDPNYIGEPTPPSPLRPDVLKAVTKSIQKLHGPQMRVYPLMSTGASDGSFFRAKGIPVYDVDGSWGISPDDERAHGLDERIPVRAMYDDVVHWQSIIRDLAS
ncbi:M20/M25/M40 family metallo-hydrolase [Sphingomonas sp. SM33]|uniref:M20/M25/M40 family metallo-hydrolase n=1 Tax=Sphingomonas telluris TaxID=2907998 RepID=A0ABS9VNZ1_9SPHN|nr:M20/M25/M40 family metallo-hydrolase [Sphingomonas telluris]MCH8616219.1 M20/M25/M40 family metallo-hydrolase [Sphingomonas telluris]